MAGMVMFHRQSQCDLLLSPSGGLRERGQVRGIPWILATRWVMSPLTDGQKRRWSRAGKVGEESVLCGIVAFLSECKIWVGSKTPELGVQAEVHARNVTLGIVFSQSLG